MSQTAQILDLSAVPPELKRLARKNIERTLVEHELSVMRKERQVALEAERQAVADARKTVKAAVVQLRKGNPDFIPEFAGAMDAFEASVERLKAARDAWNEQNGYGKKRSQLKAIVEKIGYLLSTAPVIEAARQAGED